MNLPLKLSSDLLRNDKSKTDPKWIQHSVILKKTKYLFERVLVFIFDATSCVFYRYLKKSIIGFCYYYFNVAFLCEFDCISLDTQQNLLNSLFITDNYWIVNILKICVKLNSLISCLYFLNVHYIVDQLDNIELFYLFIKLSRSYLRKIYQIID